MNESVVVEATSQLGRDVQVKVGDQLIRWKAVDIRIRPDEFVEMTVIISPDQLDLLALPGNTRLIVEGGEYE